MVKKDKQKDNLFRSYLFLRCILMYDNLYFSFPLQKRPMNIEIGQTAPDFILYDSDKNKVTLSELKGQPVLLLFFPLAFTSVCTKELCSVRDNIGWYNSINAKDEKIIQQFFKSNVPKINEANLNTLDLICFHQCLVYYYFILLDFQTAMEHAIKWKELCESKPCFLCQFFLPYGVSLI